MALPPPQSGAGLTQALGLHMSNMTPQEAASRIHLGSAVVWLIAGFLFASPPFPIWGFILLASAHVLLGIACTRWLGFGKTLTVLLALLQVLIVPVGTVIAVLLLWASIKEWSWPRASRAGELASSWPQT